MPANNSELEKRLWAAADELRANSNLSAAQYSSPVLGLIFLRYADARFSHAQGELEGKATGRRKISKFDYQARGVMAYLDAQGFAVSVANRAVPSVLDFVDVVLTNLGAATDNDIEAILSFVRRGNHCGHHRCIFVQEKLLWLFLRFRRRCCAIFFRSSPGLPRANR